MDSKSKLPGFGALGAGVVKRGPKVKVPPPSDHLIALGINVSSSTGTTSTISASSTVSKAVKREAGGNPMVPASASKKPKLIAPRRTSSHDLWADAAVDVEAHDLFVKVLANENSNNEERIDAYLCGSVKLLRSSRFKIEPSLYLTLLYLAKSRPHFFSSDIVAEAFCSLLKKDPTVNYKIKGNNAIPLLAANILYAALKDETSWPKSLVKVYVEDAVNERNWVDSPECKTFVDNIVTAFGTKIPPKSMMSQDILLNANPGLKGESPASSSPNHPSQAPEDSRDDDSSSFLFTSDLKERLEEEASVIPRFTNCQDFVREYTTEVVNEQLTRRQVPSEISRNLLKLLVATVGIQQIRLIVALRLEIWLQNPKLTRPAQDLLLGICLNCNEKDYEIMAVLVKMRLKTKPLVNHFMFGIKELLNQKEENLIVVLRQAVLNEISSTRGANNMQIVSVLFQHSPEKATKALGVIFQELLLKDDHLKVLRGLVREIIRTLRHDHLNMTLFVATLVEENADFAKVDPADSALRDRIFSSIIDLITLCMFASISPSIKEAVSTTKNDRKDVILRCFQVQVAEMQRLGVYWIQKVVMKLFKPERNEFIHGLNKLLLMESAENYYNKDNWPPENDRNFMFRLSSEVPVLEDTLIRLLNMGLSKAHPVSAPEAIEASDTLIKRAANIYDGDSSPYRVLKIQNEEIFQLLFKSSAYRIPENIMLPAGYEAPNMAISDWYWKVWIQLLIITAHNSESFGNKAWKNFPTLSLLIEMAITNHFEFPPPTRQSEDFKSRELQISSIEKQQIIQFETHLAAASTKMQINETNSLLLSKLITFEPEGVARKPPAAILDQLKTINSSLKLGHLLCQSRSPDFLLEIIQRQQKQQKSPNQQYALSPVSMPWLNELVEMHDDNYSVLPVQCLAEYLLGQIHDEGLAAQLNDQGGEQLSGKVNDAKRPKEKRRKHLRVIIYLQSMMKTNQQNTQDLVETLLKRLCLEQFAFRRLATKALNLVFQEENDDASNWLEKLPLSVPRHIICEYLRQAILVETEPKLICGYVQFLSTEHAQTRDCKTMISLSKLLIERKCITRHLTQEPFRQRFLHAVVKLYNAFINSAQRASVKVVHGIIFTVLTMSNDPVESCKTEFEELMNWSCNPKSYNHVDILEGELLWPDWLKIMVSRSHCTALHRIALSDSTPQQLSALTTNKFAEVLRVIESNELPDNSKSERMQEESANNTLDSSATGTFIDWLRTPNSCKHYLTHLQKELSAEFQASNSFKKAEKFLSELVATLKGKDSALKGQLITALKNNSLNSTITLIISNCSRTRKSTLINQIKSLQTLLEGNEQLQSCVILNVIKRIAGHKTTSERSVNNESCVEEATEERKEVDGIAEAVEMENYQKTEPEMENAESLLFTENKSYLLPILVHKTSFETLNQYVIKLLGADSLKKKYKATPVLDFLAACLASPRIWAGRDRRKPKHSVHEDVLKLNDDQIERLVDYILEEGRAENRVSLLLKSVCYKRWHVNAIIDKLKKLNESEKGRDPKSTELLVLLELQMAPKLDPEAESPSWSKSTGVPSASSRGTQLYHSKRNYKS